jgi:hypothetical protein
MMKNLKSILVLAFAGLLCVSLSAQQPEKKDQPAATQKIQKQPPLPGAGTGGNTPHATTGAVIDGNRVTVVYGRPSMKHPRSGQERKIWGTLVPWGEIWRTGADEATLLITQKPIEIAGKTIPAGAHSLWTLPKEDGTAMLIINKQIGQWGLDRANPKSVYDEANDVARVELKKETLESPVDPFTIAVERNPSGGGVIKLSWETTAYSVPFTVKK